MQSDWAVTAAAILGLGLSLIGYSVNRWPDRPAAPEPFARSVVDTFVVSRRPARTVCVFAEPRQWSVATVVPPCPIR